MSVISYAGREYEVDWALTTGQIAQSTGLDKGTVSRLRKRYAPASVARRVSVDSAQPVAGYESLTAFLGAVAGLLPRRVGGLRGLAKHLGVNTRSLARWLDGEKKPSPEMVAKLVLWWGSIPMEQPAEPVQRGVIKRTLSRAAKHRVELPERLYERCEAAARRRNLTVEQWVAMALEMRLDKEAGE